MTHVLKQPAHAITKAGCKRCEAHLQHLGAQAVAVSAGGLTLGNLSRQC